MFTYLIKNEVILDMKTKWDTLSIVYSIVKDYLHPITTLLHINELILKQNLPWDQVVDHLKELQMDGYVTIHQLTVAVISITDKGMKHSLNLLRLNNCDS